MRDFPIFLFKFHDVSLFLIVKNSLLVTSWVWGVGIVL